MGLFLSKEQRKEKQKEKFKKDFLKNETDIKHFGAGNSPFVLSHDYEPLTEEQKQKFKKLIDQLDEE